MKILTTWLRSFVPDIPVDDHQLAEDLTLRGIAVEGIHDLGTSTNGASNGHLFEMDITTNRVDAMNHYGIAREAATIYNLPLTALLASGAVDTANAASAGDAADVFNELDNSSSRPKQQTASPSVAQWRDPRILSETSPGPDANPFPIRIAPEAKHLCGRFTAQVIRNVAIASSPTPITEYFTLLGQKQISNAVDASNFVLLSMGQPTHAFDLDKIQGGIVVRLAHKGETLKLLDGTNRTLEPDDLVVADEGKALALAGVMGGWDSMITPETKNILIEAAWFDPASVRRSSRRHGLHTDASHRFERGADFNAAPIANALVAQLILQSNGTLEGNLIDLIDAEVASRTASRPPIHLSVKQVQRHLGTTLADNHTHSALTSSLIHQYLTALGCTLTQNPAPDSTPNPSNPDTTFQVQLPSWRLDLEREIDLIEEIARVYGYNRFANTLPTPGIVIAHPIAAKEAAIRTRLLALGYSESISSTFAGHSDTGLFHTPPAQSGTPPQSNLSPEPGAPYLAVSSPCVGIRASEPPIAGAEAPPTLPVPLENPLSEEASLLRPTLIPGMVTMLAHNLNRDVKEVRLFEQGHIFTGTPLVDGTYIAQVHETPQLSLGLTSNSQPTHLHSAADAPFFELKGVIESLVSLFTPAGGPAALTFTPEAPAWLQPGRSATALLNNRPIAYFGELLHTQREARKLRQPIYLAQLDLAALYDLPLKKVTAHDLSRFQAVERDFSFTFPDTLHWHKIAAAIHALSIPELQRLTPTEIFRDPKGKSVPPAHYALLLKCVFQSHDRTLREDELTSWWSTIISTLTGLGGAIRAPGL